MVIRQRVKRTQFLKKEELAILICYISIIILIGFLCFDALFNDFKIMGNFEYFFIAFLILFFGPFFLLFLAVQDIDDKLDERWTAYVCSEIARDLSRIARKSRILHNFSDLLQKNSKEFNTNRKEEGGKPYE